LLPNEAVIQAAHSVDRAFKATITGFGGVILLALGMIVAVCSLLASPAMGKLGIFSFLSGADWDPVQDSFGALPFIGARSTGSVILDGMDVYQLDPVQLRARVGMVFQRPNVFPNLSIRQNVLAGLKLNRIRADYAATLERTLRQTALWDEVKDRLDEGGMRLSGGQQQRLCIARALADRHPQHATGAAHL
jgi:energy-coupling factor transporter ATP-binding protein EcfA2